MKKNQYQELIEFLDKVKVLGYKNASIEKKLEIKDMKSECSNLMKKSSESAFMTTATRDLTSSSDT